MFNSRLLKQFVHSYSCFLHTSSKLSAKTMKAWQVFEFGGPEKLLMNTNAMVPTLVNSTDILIKVHASSINPLDVRMLEGYGSSVFGFIHQLKNFPKVSTKFPLILGRDFSGTVVHVGKKVTSFQSGDEVWGALSPWQDGSHSEYVIAPACFVSKKPKLLTHCDAASFPYAALTAWSALNTFGGLTEKNCYRKRVLIIGATGGVGTFALQILKAWGADVSVICQSDAQDLMLNLGADMIYDYKSPDFRNNLKELNGLDFIFDNVGGEYPELTISLLKKWSNSKYVTVVSPLLKNADERGLIFGTFLSSVQASLDTTMSIKDGRSFRWAYFVPNSCALKTISKMADQKKVLPVIEKQFSFENIQEAYNKCLAGHSRGKIVIDHVTINETTDVTKKESPRNE